MATQHQTLTDDQRMDENHMAVAMYSERVQGDAQEGVGEIYGRNPDARQLYFKGVHDTIEVLNTWANEGLDPTVIADWAAKLQDQTREQAQAN